ncbi:MAG TPA: LL-diaminopimelate aminotransferase [Candidatus Humimicrobiaceae bacterium]
MHFEEADRLKSLPPYLFAEIDKLINNKRKEGLDVISLGIGDPDIPTSKDIIETLCKEANDPKNHRYPSSYGLKIFKEAVSKFYLQRFNVTLDPEREVIPLMGSKEGIANLAYTCINPGDHVIMTDPSYLVYKISTIFAGGIPYTVPLRQEDDFLLDTRDIDPEIAKKAKIIYINYPNNPTSATCNKNFFEKIVSFAEKNNIIVCHDNAYSDVYQGDNKPMSFLNAYGSKNVGIEFNSLSKTFNMTGWRIGYAVGNGEIIESLGKYKTNVDSGVFNAIQYAAVKALESFKRHTEYNNNIYNRRREMIKKTLDDTGIDYFDSNATIYVWVKVPEGFTSGSFSKMLLDKANVVVTPGVEFGKNGEGYIRISMTIDDSRLEEALKRIRSVL